MILLTRLNNKRFMLNSDLIETVEANPDTVIALRNGKIYIVAESPERVYELVREFRKGLYRELLGAARPGMGGIAGDMDDIVDDRTIDDIEDGTAKRR